MDRNTLKCSFDAQVTYMHLSCDKAARRRVDEAMQRSGITDDAGDILAINR